MHPTRVPRMPAVLAAVLLAVLLAAALIVPLGALSAPAAAVPTEDPPLSVEITSVTPSSLRPGEPMQIAGTVLNVDDQQWREVKAYLVISTNPLTSAPELAAAAESSPESYIGERLTELGSFSRLGRLEEGSSADFSLDVPWRTLATMGTDGVYITGAEGVYSVGVQVLATDEAGFRDPVNAVARARTFVPLMTSAPRDRPRRVDLGMLWPLRERVLRESDGSYAEADQLAASLASEGRLRHLVDLAATADGVPVSLVADPALLDAAEDLADGRLGPPAATPGQEQAADGTVVETGSGVSDGTSVAPSPQAGDWLQDVVETFGSTGWLTGYGEPDPVTVADQATPRLRRAIQRAGQATAQTLLGDNAPTLALPEPERIDSDTLLALAGTAAEQVAVVPADRLPGWDASQGVALSLPTSADGTDLSVLAADPALAAGGPGPGDTDSALQMRQRLLCETALLSMHAVDTAGPPSALFVAPPDWDPGPFWAESEFFDGLDPLDAPWLRLTPVETMLAGTTPFAAGVEDVEPAPEALPGAVLRPDLVESAIRLARRTATLTGLVGGDPDLAAWYSAAAALGVSSYGHDDGSQRQAATQRTSVDLFRELGKVHLEGPSFVTLSSSRGRFGVSVTNGLDRSITVGVRARAFAAGLQFDTGDPVTVGPGQRQTVYVDTQADDNRVATARAVLVTRRGEPFGRQLEFSVRSSVVGVVIWVVVGAAALLLLAAIVRRAASRIVHRSSGRRTAAGT